MNFNWWTFALQAANFLILVWLLQHFLFKPVKAMVARRRQEIVSTLAEASHDREIAGRLKQEMEAQRAQMDAEREKLMEEQRSRLSAEREELLQQARAQALKLKAEAHEEVERERTAARGELFEHSIQLATALAERLLRELALPSIEHPFLARVLDYFDRLPAAERGTLLSQLGASPLLVTTAHPIGVEEQAEWRDRLGKWTGVAKSIRFAADPALIAGARLEFPHAILRFNWRDSLASAKKELQQSS
jgi:F-type H+-transporting ATPase subunit b